MKKPWEGRFSHGTERAAEEFTASLPLDLRLWREDIEGSKAYCRALVEAGVLTPEEGARILEALEEIEGQFERGEVPLDPSYEDVHMLVEALLKERLGELGGKLHTGRSRNDQVVLDMRLWLMRTIDRQRRLLRELQEAIVRKAEEWFGVIIPGYTHLRKAQPILISHWLLAYYEMLKRDAERLSDCRKRVDIMPLGSSAMAGNPYPIDRYSLAKTLGFSRISANSIDAIADRDFLLEYLSCLSILAVHLSRLAEDLILYSAPEFGFLEIPEGFCTGSSIMPQKKNPDVLELVRGKAGKVLGSFLSLAVTMKGLPMSYNRDLQEDKKPVFDASDTVEGILLVLTPLILGLQVNREKAEEASKADFVLATELADYLVSKGIAFREAHRLTGEIVKYCERQKKDLQELALSEFKGFSPLIGEDVYGWLTPLKAVERRRVPGGTAPERVREALERAKEELGL